MPTLMGGNAKAPTSTNLSRKAATAVAAVRELHIVLNCPNEKAFIDTVSSSSIINFPYPHSIIHYFYRVYLRDNPCIICNRSKMTKPRPYYLQPTVKRQLCSDIGWFQTHKGLEPRLCIIDTIEEYATIHELPLVYNAEDILCCFIERLRKDSSKEVRDDEIVADPESTIGKGVKLLSTHKKWSHIEHIKVPTKTHVALAENLIGKIRVDLRAVASQFNITHGIKMPLQFVPAMLCNIVEKMNYVSNQGTLSTSSPAIQRGEEPLDYNALIKVKIGDIVQAYSDTDSTRTSSIFIVVLDHTFSRNPHITKGFNLEIESTSAGNLMNAKFSRPNPKDIPSFIKKKLRELDYKGKIESREKIKKKKREKEFLIRQIRTCDDTNRKEILEQQLKEVPSNIDEILVQVDKEIQEIEKSDASSTPAATGTASSTNSILGGETQAAEAANELRPASNNVDSSNNLEPSPAQVNQAEETTTASAPMPSTANTQAAESSRPYNFRKRQSDRKHQSHLLYQDLNNISSETRDWNVYVMTNVMFREGEDLEEFMTFHTTISEALKEDEVPVKESVVKEWDQVLDSKDGEKSVLKCMSPDFSVRGKDVIPCMMFMKKKMNKVTKKLERWKARLAAGGHMQNPELYPKKDITVPTLDHSSLLVFLSSMMKRKGVKFHSMDFPGAYLSADLETEIYMVINKQNVDILLESKPELKQFVRSNGTIITKIQKALYGLKESGRLFRDKVVNLFDQFGLKEVESNKCIFKKDMPNGKTFYICVYVDDVIIATDDEDERLKFLEFCKQSFPEISMNSEDAFSFLGMAIKFDYKKRTIRYDNSLYIQELAENYDVINENILPCKSNFMNHSDQDRTMDDVRKYKSLVMALFYVAKRTRPDVLFPVSYLATRCATPTQEDFEKAKGVLSYLLSTKGLQLTHSCNGKDPKKLLFAFVDASYATHPDMKGHTGALIFDECGNLLYASSTKQKLMGKSSTDAEIIAVHSVMNSIEEIKDLFDELNGTKNGSSNEYPPVCLYQDNQSAKFLMENGDSRSDKSKHMKVRYFYIKSKVDESIINIKYRDTNRMWADLLTKVITVKDKFFQMRSIIMNCQEGDKYFML